MKICHKCKQPKPDTEFPIRWSGWTRRLQGTCKTCDHERYEKGAKMIVKNEGQYIKKVLRPFLEELGYKVHKSTERFSSGYPDLSAVMDGETIYIEAKMQGSKPTPLQMKEMKDLTSHGARCYVFTWSKEGYHMIKWVCKDGRLIDHAISMFVMGYKSKEVK